LRYALAPQARGEASDTNRGRGHDFDRRSIIVRFKLAGRWPSIASAGLKDALGVVPEALRAGFAGRGDGRETGGGSDGYTLMDSERNRRENQ
jgi:hypothetical protein